METSSLRSVSMSRTCGMFSRMTSPSVRMAAAMHGSAEFFAPETLRVPRSGLPPRITNLSIWLVYGWRVWMPVAEMVRDWPGYYRPRKKELLFAEIEILGDSLGSECGGGG